MKVNYKSKTMIVTKATYPNDRIALVMKHKNNARYATATVNIPDEPLKPDEVILDSNNLPGIEKALVSAGIVGKSFRTARSGFCTYPVCKLH